VISLNSFDETSLGFLANVYGESYKRVIPNLPRLHAVVFGKAVRSERPIVVEIPYVKAKDVEMAPKKSELADPLDVSPTSIQEGAGVEEPPGPSGRNGVEPLV
jgi:hypothetical protein